MAINEACQPEPNLCRSNRRYGCESRNEDLSYPSFVSKLLTELKKEQYTELNADRKAGEAGLALKEE